MRKCVECDSTLPVSQKYLCEKCFEQALNIKLEMLSNIKINEQKLNKLFT